MTTAEQRRVFLRAHHPCPLLLQLTALHGFLQGSTLSSDVSELMAADLALKPCKTLNNISKLIKWTWHKIQNSTSTKNQAGTETFTIIPTSDPASRSRCRPRASGGSSRAMHQVLVFWWFHLLCIFLPGEVTGTARSVVES